MISKDGTYIKCDYESGCIMQIRNNKWAKIKAPDWFLGHKNHFCPVHKPARRGV